MPKLSPAIVASSMPYPLLTSRWSNIVLVSYAVPPAVVRAFVPKGPEGGVLEVDTREEFVRSGERQAIVSLVAFEHSRARILGVRWPGLTSFSQINLRFYVRHQGRRGVVFIRQIVQPRLIAWGGKRFQNEPMTAAPITCEVKQAQRSIGVEYRLRFPEAGLAAPSGSREGRMQEHMLRVLSTKPVTRPGPDSLEHWLKERQWSFGMDRQGRPSVMEVIHPIWSIYPVVERDLRFDFAGVYGPDWGFLTGSEPVSAILAAGSETAVFPKRATVGVRWGEKHGGG